LTKYSPSERIKIDEFFRKQYRGFEASVGGSVSAEGLTSLGMLDKRRKIGFVSPHPTELRIEAVINNGSKRTFENINLDNLKPFTQSLDLFPTPKPSRIFPTTTIGELKNPTYRIFKKGGKIPAVIQSLR
jgi:hypothetical protein